MNYTSARLLMVEKQVKDRGVTDERVLAAMREIPRHEFVPVGLRDRAYEDNPLPIGQEQTISQPYIVGVMSQALKLSGGETVLEVGTGSGYQTAILSLLAGRVFSLERYPLLAAGAAKVLERLGYLNVEIHVGDGSQGLADMSPFDAIVVAAAAPSIPGMLRAQLHPDGGTLVIPVGSAKEQFLEVVTRWGSRWDIQRIGSVRFVPLIGTFGFSK